VSALATAWPSRTNPPAATTATRPRCTFLCMTFLSLPQNEIDCSSASEDKVGSTRVTSVEPVVVLRWCSWAAR
jgi:hypothetical protein